MEFYQDSNEYEVVSNVDYTGYHALQTLNYIHVRMYGMLISLHHHSYSKA